MVHFFLTSERDQENIKRINSIIDEINFNASLEDEISNEIDAVQKIRQIQLKQLETTDEKLASLMLKKHNLPISDLKKELEKLKKVVDNTRIIEVIVVDENKFGLSNGLVDLNRDTLMALIKIVGDEKRIRRIIGMTERFFVWSKHKAFYWARGQVWSHTYKSKWISVLDNGKTAKVVSCKFRSGAFPVIIHNKIRCGVGVLSVKIVAKPLNSDSFIGVVTEIPKDFDLGLPTGLMLMDNEGGSRLNSSSGFSEGDTVTVRVDVDRGNLCFWVNNIVRAGLVDVQKIKRGVYFAAQLHSTSAEWTIVAAGHEKR